MTALFIAVLVLAAVLFAIVLFLGNEFKKKFRFMQNFIMSSRSLLEYNFRGAGAHARDKGMGTLLIEADEPFAALIGFDLSVPVLGSGFDYYGMVVAQHLNINSGKYVAVISTYLGNGPCLFQFFLNCDVVRINAKVSLVNDVEPMAVYPPHWWQTLGFWG